jgi:uncharacterized membrane protein
MILMSECFSDTCNGGTSGLSAGIPFWGGTNTNSYKILLVMHIAAVVAAFGPTLLYPMLTRMARAFPGEAGERLARIPFKLNTRMFLPALVAVAVLGMLLIADSSNTWSMSQQWISAAFAVVIALILISWFLLRPAQARLAEGLVKGDEGAAQVRSARAIIGVSTGMYHLGLVVVLCLMIWKPGV